MHFAFTDEQAMIAETASAFFAEHATSSRTRAAMTGADGCDTALWQAFTKELGLAGVALPEADGGVGLGLVELAILAEASGRHVAALPFIASLALAATAISTNGSDLQRSDWLPQLASGEVAAALAVGPDLQRPGEGVSFASGLLNGAIVIVPHGAVADLFVVAAGSGLFLVPRSAAGVHVTPLTSMDQTRPFARLELKDVAEADAMPGGSLASALAVGWVAIAADALGGAQACLDLTVAYAKERVQFGRAIGSFQAVKHRLADMMVEVEQARSAVYWAACAVEEQAAEATLAVHAAKAFATDAYAMCAGNMIQLLGGIGFTWEHDAHLYFKRARADQSWLGSPDWHRERVAHIIGLDTMAKAA